MPSMEVKGLRKLSARINAKIKKAQKGTSGGKASVIVGYDIYYAIFVHEDMSKYHPNGKAKFLIDPLMSMKPNVARTIKRLMKRGSSMPEAILIVGERLLAKSRKEVPVDTGALHDSGYVELELGSVS